MVGMAIALNLMAAAVGQLGKMDLGALAKGVGTIAALLLVVIGFQKLAGGERLISSPRACLIGAALNVMASAVKKLGELPIGTIIKGIYAIAATLLVIVVAMNAMQSNIGGAASMVIAAAALLVMSKAINGLGSESWGAIGKALVALAGALVIMAAAMI